MRLPPRPDSGFEGFFVMFFRLSKGRHALSGHLDVPRPSAAGAFRADAADSFFATAFSMEDGPMFDPCKIPGSRSLHDRKLATWALLIGETRSSAVHAEARRRPHRGMLPDVDFSRAVPDLSRPSLVRRLVRLVRPRGERDRAVAGTPVGEKPSPAYIGHDRTEAADDSAAARGLAHAA
jgi:hypothetical protein